MGTQEIKEPTLTEILALIPKSIIVNSIERFLFIDYSFGMWSIYYATCRDSANGMFYEYTSRDLFMCIRHIKFKVAEANE